MDGVSYEQLGDMQFEEEVFLDNHDQAKSVTIAPTNIAGQAYGEVPAGTVMAPCFDGYYRPCAAALVSEAVVTDDVIPAAAVGGVLNRVAFRPGDRLFVAGSAYPRTILSVDDTTGDITVDANVSLSEGAEIYVDPSIPWSSAAAAVAVAANAVTVPAGHTARFNVGDTILIEGVTGARNITALNSGTNTITFDGATTTIADGARIVGEPLGERPALLGYKIAISTRHLGYGNGMNPTNVLIPTKVHGEARVKAVKGLRASIKAALPLIQWNYINN